MDKIERYKNLNEEVNRLLKKQQSSSLKEEAVVAAQELFETLQDPNRVTQLMKAGLVDSARINRVRSALKDPEKAIKNPSIRTDLINMLMSLINLVTSNPSAYSSVRKGLDKEEEVTEEKSVKKEEEIEEEWKSLKKTKVDLNALRQQGYRVVVQHGEGDTLYKIKGKGKKKVEEELIGNQKKIDINDNDKIDAQDLKMLRSGKKKGTDELEEMASKKASATGKSKKTSTGKKYRDDGGVHDAKYWADIERWQRENPLNPDRDHLMTGVDDHLPGIGAEMKARRLAAIEAHRRRQRR